MNSKKTILAGSISLSLALGCGAAFAQLTPVEELGQFLYFDEDLSEPSGQSCASCHDPAFGFADPDKGLPVSEGVIPGLFGGRNSPSSAYAMYAPVRYFDTVEGLWIGGQFWDGRATGDVLGDPLADQALGPFLNPVEMANPDKATVIRDVLASDYAGEFQEECGEGDHSNPVYVEAAYDCVALSIAAFERTRTFGQFTSKYDAYLKSCLDLGGEPADCATGTGSEAEAAGTIFSKKQWRGLQLFMGGNDNDGILDDGEGAMCSACHVAAWTPDPGNVAVPDWAPEDPDDPGFKMIPPMFTDFTYDNIGVPVNDEIADLTGVHPMPIDNGLGAIVGEVDLNGAHKVMSLRNIHQTAPYAHNGFFKKLSDITHFYNTRDVSDEWADAEVPDTMNTGELGNLGLSGKDEEALVKFMKTLTDGYMP